ncbi:MAG: NYN domain-containing protein [Paludisphaera borealis]|uniref:NYN domain-containing protein n=1 Tax=Paludisphaera borealis TaxID=1387353 RepID=UPI002847E633|nr:NYN domain-containing protein [Paludisphaera borealis]MDR3622124.1 NYN domain-containing protein [Paludisphaera borealis]
MTKVDRERERNLAVFIDLENLAMGFQGQRKIKFDVQKVLERLVEKGKLIVKKAYADWSRYPNYTAPFHESAIELIEIPKRSQTGKNSADIRLVVDAMDLAWSKPHVDTFVIVSGDSDFSPLVSKLKENGKHVIGLGMKGSTSELLRDNCDEFIYYEDLERQEQNEQQLAIDLNSFLPASLPEKQREVFSLLLEACTALRRENHEVLYASMIKDTMKRKKPSFDESYYGYRSFTHLLEDGDNLSLVDIERNPKSGTYMVTRVVGEGTALAAGAEGQPAIPGARRHGPPGKRDRGPGGSHR